MTYSPKPGSHADRVLTLIRNTRERHSTTELAKMLSCPKPALRGYLQPAVNAGLLRYDVIDGRGYWMLGTGKPQAREFGAFRLHDGSLGITGCQPDRDGTIMLSVEESQKVAHLLLQPVVG
jgi:hypothetical protein